MKFLQFSTLLALLMLFEPSAAANKREVIVGKVRKFNHKIQSAENFPSGEVKKFCDIFGKLGFSHFHFFRRSTRCGRVGNVCALSAFHFFSSWTFISVNDNKVRRRSRNAVFFSCFLVLNKFLSNGKPRVDAVITKTTAKCDRKKLEKRIRRK